MSTPALPIHADPFLPGNDYSLEHILATILGVEGAVYLSLCALENGLLIASVGELKNGDMVSMLNLEVLEAQGRALRDSGVDACLEEILVTLTDGYHLVQTVAACTPLFLYLVLDGKKSHLGLARYKLGQVAQALRHYL